MRKAPLGDLELETLRYIADQAPVTVGETVAGFGEPRSLARTTIATVMENLRKKGYVTRDKGPDGVYRYTPKHPQKAILRQMVQDFVEKTLGGTIAPFMAYLDESGSLTEEESAQLRRLAQKLDSSRQSSVDDRPK